MGLAYANPPFTLVAKVLTKITYEGGRVVMCTPDWGCSGEHSYLRQLVDRITAGRVQLPDSPIYVTDNSDAAMQAPKWASFLSLVDGSLNPVPLCDLDQVLLKEVMAEKCGVTLLDLKKQFPENVSATRTGCECEKLQTKRAPLHILPHPQDVSTIFCLSLKKEQPAAIS